MKKITLMLFLMIFSIGFSQQTGSDTGNSDEISAREIINTTVRQSLNNSPEARELIQPVQERRSLNNSPEAREFVLSVEDRALYTSQNTPTILTTRAYTAEEQAEISAAESSRSSVPFVVNNLSSNRSSLADIIPTAGATETFTPAVGDNFFDPGGPGGGNTTGVPGNYPNCGCVTTTTLDGVTEVTFLEFIVFATFDWLKIYDGADTSGTILFDNATGGINQGDIQLADLIASNGSPDFVGTSGSLTFEFNSSTVVDRLGWDVEIVAASGGGGGSGCNQDHPFSANAGGGSGSSVDSDFKTAADITVAAGEDFTLDTIDVPFLTFAPSDPPTTAIVVYYMDDAGLPGTMIGGETVVPTILSSGPWANPVADQYLTSLALTPFTFAGDAAMDTKYWIEVSMGTATNQATVFWEFTDDTPVEGEARAQFDGTAGTWSFPDPLTEVIYDFSGECTPIGGGAGCNQDHPFSANAGGGSGSSVDSDFKTAADITVAMGEDFTIDTIDVPFLTFAPSDPPTTAIVVYYEDAAGLPGTMIGTETVVPTILSSGPWANPVADQYLTSLALTPFTFAGDAAMDTKYWIEVSMGTATNQATVFWEFTDDTPVEGEARAQFDGTAGTWSFPDPLTEVIYDFSGECTPIGGGTGCNQDHPFSANAGGGSGSSVDSDFKTAADITVAMGEDFTIDTIDVPFLTFAPTDPPTTAIVVYYTDAAGLPGTMIGTETVVPTILSSGPWANPVADQYLTSLALTPFTFAGDAAMDTKYWIEVSMGTATNQATVFWEFTDDTPVEGEARAQFDGTAGTWSFPDPLTEVIYDFSGECSPIMVPMDNDVCTDATAVACGDTITGDTSDNTDQGGANTSPDEWFKFTGTGVAQVVTVSLCDGGTAFDSVISVYDACGGTQIAFNDDSCGLQSEVSFASDGTSTYYIAVEGFGANAGPFSLAVTCELVAANDLCENAIPIACGDSIMGTTNNSTIDDAVAPLCDTGVTSPGVWYLFDDQTGLASDVTITLCGGGTAFDSKLSVYTGDCGAPPLTCVVGNDDSCGLQSEVTFSSDGNTTFYVLVHGFGGQTGDFSLDITCDLIPPPNDMIANSIDIDEAGCPYTDTAVAMPAATVEGGNPTGCNINGANGVWYNYTPTVDGFITGTIVSPAGASSITFYDAPSENATVTELSLVIYFQNQCLPGTTATIPVVAGQAYYAFVLNTGGVTDITFDCGTLGVDDNKLEGFTFYPNPADSTINLSAANNIESVEIFNILGQTVISSKINATTGQLDVANLTTGTYIMKVSVNGEIGTYKVVKR